MKGSEALISGQYLGDCFRRSAWIIDGISKGFAAEFIGSVIQAFNEKKYCILTLVRCCFSILMS